MKCAACRYDDKYGTKPFIRLEVSGKYKTFSMTYKGNLGWGKREDVYLYACPECGVVQLSEWDL